MAQGMSSNKSLSIGSGRSQVGVVYLARKQDGLAPFQAFLNSYQRFPAGMPHDFLIVLKGFANESERGEYSERMKGMAGASIAINDFGFDIRAYRLAAAQLECEHLFFFNTFSEILAAGWLVKTFELASRPGVGLVGATGSWESMYSNLLAEQPSGLMAWPAHWLRKLVSRFCFDAFPNPHVRTNAFLVRRELFLKVWPRFVLTKRGAYLFENGRNSFTKRVLQEGLEVLVVGRNGLGYPHKDWNRSGTFRQGEQENLLVADNQTRRYASAGGLIKKQLACAAWG